MFRGAPIMSYAPATRRATRPILAATAALLLGAAPALAQGTAPAPRPAPAADDAAGEVLRSRGTPQGRAAAASRGAQGETPPPAPAPATPAPTPAR